MKEFIIEDLSTWMHQNEAEEIDTREGCLIDPLLCFTKNGVVFIAEEYVNPNMSQYHAHFARNNDTEAIANVLALWERFTNAYDSMYEEN